MSSQNHPEYNLDPKYKWKKGRSGNPGGKPRGIKNIKSIIEYFGRFEAPKDMMAKVKESFPRIKKICLHEAIVLRAYQEALAGQAWAVQFLSERGEGKVKQAVDVTTDGEKIKQDVYNVVNISDKEKLEEMHVTADAI
jgi:hypothetical protein